MNNLEKRIEELEKALEPFANYDNLALKGIDPRSEILSVTVTTEGVNESKERSVSIRKSHFGRAARLLGIFDPPLDIEPIVIPEIKRETDELP